MKLNITLLTSIFQILIFQKMYSQIPHIEWQRCYGGTGNEYIRDLIPTKDGNYIVMGSTTSLDGDVGPRIITDADAWVLKFNKRGDIIWSKTLFNRGYYGVALAGNETENEDILISAYVYSSDAWGFKLNKNGNKIWSKYGIPLVSQQIIKDFEPNKFVGIRNTYNINHQSSSDFTLAKIDTTGLASYDNKYGGNRTENVYSVTKTTDNCYIMVGWTFSNNSGDVGINNAREDSGDIWVVKINSTGNIIWQKSLGKANVWEECFSVVSDGAGGCVLAGTFYPSTYDAIPDIGIYHLDNLGNLVWQKNYGGTGSERPTCIAKDIDGGYVVSARTNSTNGNISGYHGGDYDGWLLKVDRNGNLVWQICLGGSSVDELQRVYVTPGGDYIVAGYTKSNDGDVSGYHGSNPNQEWGDSWILRLSNSYCSNSEYITSTISNSQTFKTNSTITALNTITNTGNVIYNAKNNIILNPGFQVSQNGKFYAVVDGCDN
ncbi:hypothetical protein GCM10011514_41360 [Emticicia aquatilis]|uniref:T9SS C-terminal target domain-containing protein n=1 Tax=Emticicia aquatilis TaxID=1537369 RepID=A0A916Z213_9BACT|nr:3-coathanger stack domain-containing protein [Emticicia aquatilis]GGD73022.1 hypothetical protein GCM10011514_41360 [Emticicia aquatilis]